jgi:hypothetical protein
VGFHGFILTEVADVTKGVSGGDKFGPAIKAFAGKIRSGSVRVGFLEGATYPETGQSVAEVASLNEYGHTVKKGDDEGSYFVLPRPFFRRMIAAKKPEWPDAMALQLKRNNYDVERTLTVVGAAVGGQLQQSIRDLTSPPLAPSTIARKGFDKPLIDSAHMLNSVDHEVEMK